MLRFLQILAAVVLVRLVWGAVKAIVSRARPRVEVSEGPRRAKIRGEVVGCARCDLHVPKAEVVVRRGLPFCSRACAAEGAAGADG